jgi:predicted DNA-binding transcriptional regulator YafY
METPRLSRCLRLLCLLQSHLGFRVEDLAREMGVCKRTVFRDFNVLKDAGISVQFDDNRGTHRVYADYPIKVSRLQREELECLVAAACTSPLANLPKTRDMLVGALAKLVNQASSCLRNDLATLVKSCSVLPSSKEAAKIDEGDLHKILTALSQNKAIRIVPVSAIHFLQTKFTPYRLIASSAGWHLLGRSSWHRRLIRIGLHNIKTVEILDEAYEMPRRFRRLTFSTDDIGWNIMDYDKLVQNQFDRPSVDKPETRRNQARPLLKSG